MALAAESAASLRLRATQTLVTHMGFVWQHPSLVALEVLWRWLFGVPFLWVVWTQVGRILADLPLESVGFERMGLQNPWLTSVLVTEAIGRYQPSVIAVLQWLVPVGVVGWSIVSGIGRMLVLAKMRAVDPDAAWSGRSFLRTLPGFIALQGLWMMALLGFFWLWFHAVGRAAAVYITAGVQPDLVGYLCWLIVLSLGLYTLWAMVSWTLAVAPLVLALEADMRPEATLHALARSFRLRKALSGKLMEVSLVLAIVKIMLIVLDMVFSAAPLPFADEFGPDALHVLYVVIFIGFLVGNDYFHVVRVRAFVELRRHYVGNDIPASKRSGSFRLQN